MKDFIKRSLQRRIIASYITASISITLLLLMIGSISLIYLNTNKILKYAKESILITIIIKETADENAVNEFIKILDNKNFTKTTEFVSKEEALRQIESELDEDPMEILDYNPLPATIKLKLKEKYANIDSIASIEEQLKQNLVVKGIFYPKATVNHVNKRVNILNIIISFFAFLMVIVSIVLINNTVRLNLHSKRFIVKTMQLVGATNYFISKPFVIKSLILGAISSMISILMLIISIIFLQGITKDIIIISGLGKVLIITFLAGILLTSGSTIIALYNFLNADIKRLYY